MEIKVGNYSVKYDRQCFSLVCHTTVKEGKNAGNKIEKVIGYYPTEAYLVKGAYHHELGNDLITTVEQMKEIADEIIKKVEVKHGK